MTISKELLEQVQEVKDELSRILEEYSFNWTFELSDDIYSDGVAMEVIIVRNHDEIEFNMQLHVTEKEIEIHVYEDHTDTFNEEAVWRWLFFQALEKIERK